MSSVANLELLNKSTITITFIIMKTPLILYPKRKHGMSESKCRSVTTFIIKKQPKLCLLRLLGFSVLYPYGTYLKSVSL